MVQHNNQHTTPFIIQAQYIKDFSFENPDPIKQIMEKNNITPSISVDIQAEARPLFEKNYEVILNINVNAKREDEPMFIIELSYAALVTLNDVDQDFVGGILMVHTPSLLFPFARSIIADATKEGGFQPLLLAPVDFAYLYHQQQENNKSTH